MIRTAHTVQGLDPLFSEPNKPMPHLIPDSSVVGRTKPKVRQSWHLLVTRAGFWGPSNVRKQ